MGGGGKEGTSRCPTNLRIGETQKKPEYALESTASHWRTAVAARRDLADSDSEGEKEAPGRKFCRVTSPFLSLVGRTFRVSGNLTAPKAI